MKKITTLLLLCLLTLGATAQNAKRQVAIFHCTGDNGNTMTAFDIDSIDKIKFITLENFNITLAQVAVTDASVKVSFSPTDKVKSATYYLDAAPDIVYTQTCDGSSWERTWTDLQPSTTVTVYCTIEDEYGITKTVTLALTTQAAPAQQAAKVGDYFYADGTWSTTRHQGKTVVGIVFSTTPTDKDKAKGFTNGYAMAIKSLTDKAKWSNQSYAEFESGAYASLTDKGYITDRDGYTHSTTLIEGITSSVQHDAALSATQLSKPRALSGSNSGWYLPSMGQMIDIMVNLGGLSTDSITHNETANTGTWKGLAKTAINNLNARLNPVGGTLFSTSSAQYIWTSSESTARSAYYLYMNYGTDISTLTYYKTTEFEVRPVVAF